MDNACSLLTVGVLLIASFVNSQHMALRHNGSTIDANTFIFPESSFYIECETKRQGRDALALTLPSVLNCVECYNDGTSFVKNECIDFVDVVCSANTSLLGQFVVEGPPQGTYECSHYSAQNTTTLVEGVLVDNATVHGKEYAILGEGINLTCSTNLATPRPSVKWLTTINGTEIVIEGETDDTEDDNRYYSTINFIIPVEKMVLDIMCLAQQVVFAVAVTSDTLNIPIHVRAQKPLWVNETGPIYFKPDVPLRLTILSSEARPTANATWFIHANGTDEPLIGNQSSSEKGEKVWYDIEFIPKENFHGMKVHFSINQGPPLYEQNSSSRELLIETDQTTQNIVTTIESQGNQVSTTEPQRNPVTTTEPQRNPVTSTVTQRNQGLRVRGKWVLLLDVYAVVYYLC